MSSLPRKGLNPNVLKFLSHLQNFFENAIKGVGRQQAKRSETGSQYMERRTFQTVKR